MLTTPIRDGAYYQTKARGVVGPMVLRPKPADGIHYRWARANNTAAPWWDDAGIRMWRGDGDDWDVLYECDAQGNRIDPCVTGGSPAIGCVDDTRVLGTVTTETRKGYVGIYRSKSTDKMLSTYVCDTRAAAETRYDEHWSLITVLEFDMPEDAV